MTDKFDYLFKILLVGNSGVGKSCILIRYADDQFSDTYLSTIGVDFKIRTIVVDDKIVKLQIWDTAGQERFRTITSSYYRGANGVIAVYDITNRSTFLDVERVWIDEIKRYALGGGNIKILLVGNKCDLENKREVEKDDGSALALKLGGGFFETSAKKAINTDIVFTELARAMKDEMVMLNAIKDKMKITPGVPVEGNNQKKCMC